jgi:hypothetical protein
VLPGIDKEIDHTCAVSIARALPSSMYTLQQCKRGSQAQFECTILAACDLGVSCTRSIVIISCQPQNLYRVVLMLQRMSLR